jgi:predicted lipid-binding transport protein (Tim44 family)
MTFVALFGGIKVFGLLGLIVGPVIATVAIAVLRTYDREVCAPLANDEAISAHSRPSFASVPSQPACPSASRASAPPASQSSSTTRKEV